MKESSTRAAKRNQSTERNPDLVKARKERAAGYPERAILPYNSSWDSVGADYNPQRYTASKVLEMDRSKDPTNPKLWADPEDIALVTHKFKSYEGEVRLDTNGYPLNPKGPTGLGGRGLLGKWGANFAADPIVTRINDEKFEMIAIRRGDSGEIAIPGGMVDEGERISQTLKRELGEETSATLDFQKAVRVYQGYVDDPRNTDNAWMETDAYHLHLSPKEKIELVAGDDAREAFWKVVDKNLLNEMYASHANMVLMAVTQWQKNTGFLVRDDGKIRHI